MLPAACNRDSFIDISIADSEQKAKTKEPYITGKAEGWFQGFGICFIEFLKTLKPLVSSLMTKEKKKLSFHELINA